MNERIKELALQAQTELAEQILSVQPMDSTIMKDLFDASTSEEQLKEEGYKPVSRLGLLWIKD